MTDQQAAAPTRIDANNARDIVQWSTRLNVSPSQIKDAVRAVGNQAADVELHLKSVRSATN